MNEVTNPAQDPSEFEKLLAESQLNSELKEGTIIKGTISEIDDDAVMVDIGAKVEGRIAKREFIFSKDKDWHKLKTPLANEVLFAAIETSSMIKSENGVQGISVSKRAKRPLCQYLLSIISLVVKVICKPIA